MSVFSKANTDVEVLGWLYGGNPSEESFDVWSGLVGQQWHG